MNATIITVCVICWIICGLITMSMNVRKGYDGGFWWGFLFGPLGIIIVGFNPDLKTRNMLEIIAGKILLDLGDITQEEFDKIKKGLVINIKDNA